MSNKKYNILLVHNFYQKPGGEDTVFYNEKKLLEENGHKVITYTRDNKELKKYSILKKILLPITIIFNFKTYFDIKRIIKENDIDIVHVHNTLSLISPSVFYAAVKMKKPVVQTLHNFRMQCPNGLFYRDGHICEDCVNAGLVCAIKHKCYRNSLIQTLAIVIMTKFHRLTGIYKRVNFICLTEFNKQKLLLLNRKKQIVDENKIYVKPNFVFESNIDKIDNSDTEDYYLYVGRLDEIKGIDTVLSAFSKMPNKKLHVVGSGGEEYIKEYSKYKNIEFLGQLSHDEVMREMKSAKSIIYPTKLFEGQPVGIIEAYMNKCPTIVSNIGNAKELVVNDVTGLYFDIEHTNSLIDSIERLEKMNIQKLKKNAYIEYTNKYDAKTAIEIIDNIYSQIMGKYNNI